MTTVATILHPRFPTGPDTKLDMPLDSGFMSGVIVQDHSSSNNHGTAAGDALLPIPQYPGFLFDATDNQSVGDSTVLSNVYPISMCCWHKPTDTGDPAERSSFAIGIAADRGHIDIKTHVDAVLEHNATTAKESAHTGTVWGNQPVVIGQWKCIVFTTTEIDVDFSSGTIYINGELDESKAGVNGMGFHDNWKIGNQAATVNSNPFTGCVGDCLFFTRELSAAEAMSYFQLTRHKYGV